MDKDKRWKDKKTKRQIDSRVRFKGKEGTFVGQSPKAKPDGGQRLLPFDIQEKTKRQKDEKAKSVKGKALRHGLVQGAKPQNSSSSPLLPSPLTFEGQSPKNWIRLGDKAPRSPQLSSTLLILTLIVISLFHS